MALHIENERIHELARRAAALTGRSLTGAIEEALELLLRTHGEDPAVAWRQHKINLVHSLAVAYQADPGDEAREIRAVEDLYENGAGLPR